MFTPSKIRALGSGKRLKGDHGLFARANTDLTVTIFMQKKIKGDNASKTRKLGTLFKESTSLKLELLEVQQKAIKWSMLMDEGNDPKYLRDNNSLLKDSMTLNQLLVEFEESRNTYGVGNAPKTMRDRRNTIENVFNDWLHKDVKLITKQNLLERFRVYSNKHNGCKPQTQKGMRYLRSVLNYGINKLDIMDKNPCVVFEGQLSLTSKPEEKKFLYPSETKKLLRFINGFVVEFSGKHLIKKYNLPEDADTPYRIQTYNLIKLLLLSGLRKGECLSLKWEQVHLNGSEYSKEPFFEIVTSKQKQPFGVPITEDMLEVFKYQEIARDVINLGDLDLSSDKGGHIQNSEYVFPSPNPKLHKGSPVDAPMENTKEGMEVLNTLLPELKQTDKIRANILRKTFATTAYTLGLDMDRISQITGHVGNLSTKGVATESYVARKADDHRKYFQDINEAFKGKIIKDNELRETPDEVADSLPSLTPQQIDELSKYGVLTEEEKETYEVNSRIKKQNEELRRELAKGSEEVISYIKKQDDFK